MAPSKLSDSDKQQMTQLYCQPGETTSTLANKFGVSSSTVSRVLKQQLSEEDYARLMQWKRSGERGNLEIDFGAVESPPVPKTPLSESPKEDPAETEPISEAAAPQDETAPLEASPERLKDVTDYEDVAVDNGIADEDSQPQPASQNLEPVESEIAESKTAVHDGPEIIPTASEETSEVEPEESSLDTEIPDPDAAAPETSAPPTPILSHRRSRQRSRTAGRSRTKEPALDEADSADQLPLQFEAPEATEDAITRDSDDLLTSSSSLERPGDDSNMDDETEDNLTNDWEADEALHDPDGSDDYEDDYDDEDLAEEDEEDWEDTPDQAAVPAKRLQEQLEILPLDALTLKRPCYLVIDRLSELITCPLKDFSELGLIPESEEQARTLPVFDNHRVARRFSRRNQRIVKLPDGKMLAKTQHYLHAKGITRILFDGNVYALN